MAMNKNLPHAFPPVGVKTFDLRRIRRRQRTAKLVESNFFLKQKLDEALRSKKALVNIVNKKDAENKNLSAVGHLKAAFRRIFKRNKV